MKMELRNRHLTPEQFDLRTRRRLLARMKEHVDNGYRDPELLYMGGRYASSMAMWRTANYFLDKLGTMLCPDGEVCEAYAPVGLLLAEALHHIEKRGDPPEGKDLKSVLTRLDQLAPRVPGMKRALDSWKKALPPPEGAPDSGKSDPIVPGRFKKLLCSDVPANEALSVFIREEGKGSDESGGTGPAGACEDLAAVREAVGGFLQAVPHPFYRVVILSKAADGAYDQKQLMVARFLLEEILALDSDQPEALRNLITVTGEQKDEEAYGRYWKRFVRCLLGRILRGDGAEAAWEDLGRFYRRVFDATERECNKPVNEMVEIIDRPGFLPAWIEAVGALVWLDALQTHRLDLMADVDSQTLSLGTKGVLSLMRFWFQVFYPDYFSFLDLEISGEPKDLPMTVNRRSSSGDDPACILVKRFLQWREFQFGLSGLLEGSHFAAVTAMAGLVVRIPEHRYVKEMAKFCKDRLRDENRSIKERVSDACSLINRIRMHKAYQCCEDGEVENALNLACAALPFFTEDDLEEKAESRQIFFYILHTAIKADDEKAGNGDPAIKPASLKALSEFNRDENGVDSLRNALLNLKNLQDELSPAERRVTLLRKRIKALTVPDLVASFHGELLQMIDNAFMQIVLNPQIEQIVDVTKEFVGKGWFDEARTLICKISTDLESGREVRSNLLRQIDEVEKQQKEIEEKIKRSKEQAEQGDFASARQTLLSLPDEPDELKDLKKKFLEQIESAMVSKQVDAAIEKSKKFVADGDFDSARRLILALPSSPGYVWKLKQSLMSQIDDAEEQSGLKKKIDEAIEESRKLVDRGDFKGARRVINNLPNRPADLQQLKQNLLDQIAQVEQQMATAKDDAFKLVEKLQRRGVNMEAVFKIAKDNNVDVSNMMQFYSLLKAIDEKF